MKKYIPRQLAAANNIKVNVTHVYFPKIAYEFWGKPKRVDFYYDREKRAIRVSASDKGLLYCKDNHQINCQLSKIMPLGNYIYDEDSKVYLFVE